MAREPDLDFSDSIGGSARFQVGREDACDKYEERVVRREEYRNRRGAREGRALASAPRRRTQFVIDPRLQKVISNTADERNQELDKLCRSSNADADDYSDRPSREIGSDQAISDGCAQRLSACIHFKRIV